MWWLVKIRPSAETNEDDPFGARAEESRTWSSHSCDGSNPYLAFTLSLGNALNNHIPSSAKARLLSVREKRNRKATMRLVMMAPDAAKPRSKWPGPRQGLDAISKLLNIAPPKAGSKRAVTRKLDCLLSG